MGEPTDRRLVSKTSENQVRLLASMRSATLLGERACTLLIQQREAFRAAGGAARIPALSGRQEGLPRASRTPVMGMTAKGAGAPCKRCRSRFDSDLLHADGMSRKGQRAWFGARQTGFESLLPDSMAL